MTINTKNTYLMSFWASIIIAIGLMVTGFFMPPRGKIDGSVLEGAGIRGAVSLDDGLAEA